MRPVSPRPLWVGIAGLSVLLAVAVAGFAPRLLFELIGRDQERWVERFATGYGDVVVQIEDGHGPLPYVLPGPADTWAGGKPHRVGIRFVAPPQAAVMLLRVADAHYRDPPLLLVSVNGREAGRVQVRRGMGLDPRDTEGGRPSAYRLEIPAALLDPSQTQTLTLENVHGAWLKLVELRLLRSAPSFSILHYFDPGPPPLWSLLALGLGLLAAWAADRCPIRERRGALVLLGLGLALVALLAATPWPPRGVAWEGTLTGFLKLHVPGGSLRAGWLLLALGFVAALLPGLPRSPVPRLLNVTAFVTGAVMMVLEMVGFRLLSPFFGYSIYLWGALLGVVMAALAAGYYLAGWLSDRWPDRPLLYQSLLATAGLILIELYAYPFVVRLSVNLPLVSGALLAALLLVFLPMAGLSLTPPFAIRALAASEGVGGAAGRIYALGTAGSIVGTFGSAFFLVTALGPRASWAAGGLGLLVLAAYGLFHYRGRPAVLVALGLGLLVVLTQPLIPEISVASLKDGRQLYSTESDYSHLEVIEVGRTLRVLPYVGFTHTIYDEEAIFDPIVTFGLLPSFLTEPRRTTILGMGGGTLARLYLHVYPRIQLDGVDIDPAMIRLGKRFLGLRDDPRLRIFVEDARAFLAKAPPARYDLVVVDLWQGGVFIPYYTVTREFFALAREGLAPGGVLAIVIGQPRPLDSPLRQAKYDQLFKAVGNSLAAVFPSVFSYPVADIANFFVATREPTSLEAVRTRLRAGGIPEVEKLTGGAIKALREYRSDPDIAVLTDDLAPVDQLIYDAFFRH